MAMANDDYNDQINPPEETGSAITKSLGHMAATMGLFIGGQAAVMMGMALGKSSLFKNLAKAGSSTTVGAAAKYASSRGNSLTSFIAKTSSKDTVVGKLSRYLDTKSHSPMATHIQAGWKAKGLGRLEKYKEYNALTKTKRTDLMEQWGSRYARETAVLLPTFYAMEQGVGLLQKGPEHEERPAWWNVPGHAVGMAKYIPTYLLGDVVGRAGFKAAGAGLEKLGNLAETALPSVLQDGIISTISYLQKGKHLEKKIGSHTLKEYFASAGATKDAFIQSVMERPKMRLATQKTMSKYEKTGKNFADVRGGFKSKFNSYYNIRYQRRLEQYVKRQQRAGKDGAESVEHHFDDVVGFMQVGTKGSSDYAQVIDQAPGAIKEIQTVMHQAFFNENRKLPFLARVLGMQRAKGANFKDTKTIGSLYDDALVTSRSHGGPKATVMREKSKEQFVDKILTRNSFYSKKLDTVLDFSPLSAKHWTSKALNSKMLVLGGRFSVADLFPFKVFSSPEMHRVITAKDMLAINPSNQMGITPWRQKTAEGQYTTQSNIHKFYDDNLGLLTRKAGDKKYNLFDYDPDNNSWNQVAQNLKVQLNSDSSKLASVHVRGLLKTPKLGDDDSAFSDNPIKGWAQKHLGLLDNKGASPSVFSRLRMFLPDSVNNAMSPNDPIPYSSNRARNTVNELKRVINTESASNLTTKDQGKLKNLRVRLNSLGSKVSKDTFKRILSQDDYMSDIINFLSDTGRIASVSGKNVAASEEKLVNVATEILQKRTTENLELFNSSENINSIDNIIKAMKIGNRGLGDSGAPSYGETPLTKVKRFIYEFSLHQTEHHPMTDSPGITSILTQRIKENVGAGKVSKQDLPKLEFSLFNDRLRYKLKHDNIAQFIDDYTHTDAVKMVFDEALSADDVFLRTAREYLQKNSLTGEGAVIDELSHQLGAFDTVWSNNTEFSVDSMARSVSTVTGANPFSVFPDKLTAQIGIAAGWANDTVNNLISHAGLGWDPGRFNTNAKVATMWGKRTAAFAGGALGYSMLDTFVDTSSLFDWSMFDEGITVGVADQAVKARMAAGWVSDKLGIDDASQYLEGLMPGITKVAPGAAMGFMAGGVKGAAIGGILNAYLQPQLEEGPLGFLAAVPGVNFFVTDPTLGFEELQNIYEGNTLLPVKKGKGWTLSTTPIEGGRVERYEPGWYPRLKSQYKASPTLYGSKVEQFLAKDVPFLDFSLMDLVDPHYLEYKQYEDRPYPIPSTPFSEVPFAGPVLGASVGRLYNLLHPLGQTSPMHSGKVSKEYMGGTSTNFRGESMGTYGPQYSGYLGTFNKTNLLPGQTPRGEQVMSPHNMKPLIGEQVYKGFIEPIGLPGFITSAMLWGGDEPFANIPLAESANTMDSMARSYWDTNLGDLAGSTELLRRAIPRPRTSYDKVNMIKNSMPSWTSPKMQEGDPYCLHPETLVETYEGLKPARDVKQHELIRTLNGHFFPVHKIVTRPVDEEIYVITVDGLEDMPLRVTGGHPFRVDVNKTDAKWMLAKDLTDDYTLTYPLAQPGLPAVCEVEEGVTLDINESTSYNLGLLARWCKVSEGTLVYRDEIAKDMRDQIESLTMFGFKEITGTIDYLQKAGLPPNFRLSSYYSVLNYISPFLVRSEITKSELIFRFHTQNAAYSVWSTLHQFGVATSIKGTDVVAVSLAAVELAYDLDINKIKHQDSDAADYCDARGRHDIPKTLLSKIVSIKKEHYKGLVYTIDMDEPETYVLPGAVVHNSKVAHGELLLPGEAYENFFNPDIAFPTGMSRLGYTPYEQALSMVGLGSFSLEAKETMEEGTEIHEMVQNQLLAAGLATKTEALISDPELNLRSYADVMFRDPSSNQELPLEIKSISAQGFSRLKGPKWKHKVQLNSYMAAMGVNQGRFLYVERDDPTHTKEFNVRFNPELWERTKTNLHHARSIAADFLEQGYGTAKGGYSYLDRMRVLLNASPYSKEYRENEKLLTEQSEKGYLSLEEQEELSELQQQHKHLLRKYEMHPRRFELSQLLDPSEEYSEDLSLNQWIKPASEYSFIERVAGSFWETATHLRSPVHTKLIGAYSPTEQYENIMLKGDFASWITPVESFVKPWSRGLIAVDNPLQGAISWGTGGGLLGGVPGAIVGGAIGATYGAIHGINNLLSGERYKPDTFQDKQDIQKYFDNLQYMKSREMYRSTGDKRFLKGMQKTQRGWYERDKIREMSAPTGEYTPTMPSSLGEVTRYAYQAYGMAGSPDKGFHSPYGGVDEERAFNFDANYYSGFGVLPAWNRPFWAAFAHAPEDDQENILKTVDSEMGKMLKVMWGRGEEVLLPSVGDYFSNKNYPSFLNPIMDPTVEVEDIQLHTVEELGLNAHDFGLGWKDQMTRIRNSAFSIQPININAIGESRSAFTNLSGPDIRDALNQVLTRMGYNGANVMVETSAALSDETAVTVNIKRTSTSDLVNEYYGED